MFSSLFGSFFRVLSGFSMELEPMVDHEKNVCLKEIHHACKQTFCTPVKVIQALQP
jgi:hypothetical protein